MLRDVDHGAVRIAHEETLQPPLLIRQRVDDFGLSTTSPFVDGLNVINFDGNVGVDVSLDVELHHAQLDFTLIRPEEEDPIEPIAAVEADDIVIERPAFVEA